MATILVEKATTDKLERLGIHSWDSWGCDVSKFDWQYEQDERAYITSGRVIVSTADDKVEIEAGDLVFFPKGLKCTWDVIEAIDKVYRFE